MPDQLGLMELLIISIIAADLSASVLVYRLGRRRALRARLMERLEWIRWEECAGFDHRPPGPGGLAVER
jgi:hypothetical protein